MKFPSGLDLPKVALPWHQQLMMRIYMGPFVASFSDTGKNRQSYEMISAKIIELAGEIPFSKHTDRVLVPSHIGLLDDTRYWSIAMTLEHLLLVDSMSKEIILRLAFGRPAGVTMTVDKVAPTGKISAQKVFEDYKDFVPSRLDEIDRAIGNSASELTEVHPLFGAFTARQWQWSMAARTWLRYRQLVNIRKGLGYDSPVEPVVSQLPKSPGV